MQASIETGTSVRSVSGESICQQCLMSLGIAHYNFPPTPDWTIVLLASSVVYLSFMN